MDKKRKNDFLRHFFKGHVQIFRALVNFPELKTPARNALAVHPRFFQEHFIFPELKAPARNAQAVLPNVALLTWLRPPKAGGMGPCP